MTSAPDLAAQAVYSSKTGFTYSTIQAAIDATGSVAGTGGVFVEIQDSLTYAGSVLIDSTRVSGTSSSDPFTLRAATGQTPVITSSSTSTIEVNGVHRVTLLRLRVTGSSGPSSRCIYFTGSEDSTVDSCRIYQSEDHGLVTGPNTHRLTIQNCRIWGNGTGGTHGNGVRMNFASGVNTFITLQNCLFYENRRSAIHLQPESSTLGIDIANNTFHNNGLDTTGTADENTDIFVSNIGPAGIRIRNNIFKTTADTSDQTFVRLGTLASLDVAGSDYNYYYSPVGTTWKIGSSFLSFTDWRLGSGADLHSVSRTDPADDPAFGDDATSTLPDRDYHLQSSYGRCTNDGGWVRDSRDSPCIDGANPLDPYTRELEDNGNRRDLGAYGNTAEAAHSGAGLVAPATGGTRATLPSNYWIGHQSSTWNTQDHGNWAHGVPTRSAGEIGNAVIDSSDSGGVLDPDPSSATVTVAADTTCNDLTLATGSAWIATGLAGARLTLTVGGRLTVSPGTSLTLDRGQTLDLVKAAETGHVVSGTLTLRLGQPTAGPTVLKLGADSTLDFTGGSTINVDLAGDTGRFPDATDPTTTRYVLFTRSIHTGNQGYGIRLQGTIDIQWLRFQYLRGTTDAVPRDARCPLVVKIGAKSQLQRFKNLQFARLVDGTGGTSLGRNKDHNKYLLLYNATSTHADGYGLTPTTVDVFPNAADADADGQTPLFYKIKFDIPGSAPAESYTPPSDYHMAQKNSAGDLCALDWGGSMGGHRYDLDGTSEGGSESPLHGAAWDTDYSAADPAGTGPGVDDLGGGGTTAVSMLGYRATGWNGAVDVTWETGVESTNLGFNILRAISPLGPWVQLNRSMILGQGDSWGGGKYLFRDTSVANGTTYDYLIQDVEYDGSVRSHGPASATPRDSAGAAPAVDAAAFFSTGRTQPEPASPGPLFPGSPVPAPTPAPDRPATATGGIETSGPAWGPDLRLAGIRVLHFEPGRVVIEIVPPAMVREQVQVGRARPLFDIVRMGGYGLVRRPGWPLVPETTISLRLPRAMNPRWRTLRADPLYLAGYKMLWRAGDPEAGDPAGPDTSPPKDDDDTTVLAVPRGASRGSAAALLAAGTPLEPEEVRALRSEMLAAIHEERAGILAAVAAARKGRLLGSKSPVAAVVRRSLAPVRLPLPGLRGAGFVPPPIELGPLAMAGGERLLPVTIHPVEYAPASGTLKVYRQHVVEIRYDIEGQGAPTPAEQDADLAQRLAAHWRISSRPGAAKIAVSRDGVYRVSQAALAAAGFDTGQDPRAYQLFHRGVEVPIRVSGEDDGSFDPADYIELAGFRNLTRHEVTGESLYTDTSVYWLVAGLAATGQRVETVADPRMAGIAGDTFTHTAWHNDQKIHFGTMQAIGPGHDYWFSINLASVGGAPAVRTLAVPTPGRTGSGTASLELRLYGRTTIEAVAPDHHVQVRVGGVTVADVLWDGAGPRLIGASFPASLLADGTTPVEVRAPGDRGVTELYYLDSVKIAYERTAASVATPLLVPDSVTADTANDYPQAAHGADWLAIAHPDFIPGLAPLAAHRQGQGLRTFVADVFEVYDAFSFGELDPVAIRRFLRHAYRAWARPRPRHVLLVGDATFDYKNYLGRGGMFVPTCMVPTAYFRTASDQWFACVDGDDDLPDLAIGRLPVRTAAQLAVWVGKLITADANPESVRKKALFVADNPDVFEFAAANAELAALLPAGFEVEHAGYPGMGVPQLRARILRAFDDGVALIHYNGHGAIQQWGQERFLHNSDEPSLANAGRHPVVLVNNCLTGYFADASLNSMSEVYTQTADRGALAFIASTSLNTPWGQHQLAVEIYRLLAAGVTELGPLLTAAKARVGAVGGGNELDVIRSWVLIGDPASKLAWPR